MIKAIFNGFFRSGTTYIWKSLKQHNSCKVYYEPLNPNILIFRNQNSKNKLHKEYLWEEYDETILQSIREKHPGILLTQEIPRDTKRLLDYLNIFHYSPEINILQTNRLHFHYE